MDKKHIFALRRNAALIGGWLFGLYYLVVEIVNRLALPGVPLADPPGGILFQLIIYILIGGLLGLIATLPSATLMGAALGGLVGSASIMLFNLVGVLDSQAFLGGMALITLIAIIPTALLLTPVSWAVRFAAESLTPDGFHPSNHIRWNRAILVSLLFVVIGTTAIFPSYVRDALNRTHQMVQNAINEGQVSPNLQQVWGFPQAAHGSYQLEWSDDWQSYIGTYAATLDELSAFLVRVRFENGFVITCIASSTTAPVCLNQDHPFGQ